MRRKPTRTAAPVSWTRGDAIPRCQATKSERGRNLTSRTLMNARVRSRWEVLHGLSVRTAPAVISARNRLEESLARPSRSASSDGQPYMRISEPLGKTTSLVRGTGQPLPERDFTPQCHASNRVFSFHCVREFPLPCLHNEAPAANSDQDARLPQS